jgi:hypothetical protein
MDTSKMNGVNVRHIEKMVKERKRFARRFSFFSNSRKANTNPLITEHAVISCISEISKCIYNGPGYELAGYAGLLIIDY